MALFGGLVAVESGGMLAQIRSVAEARSAAVCSSSSGVSHGSGSVKSMAAVSRGTQTRSIMTKVAGASVRPKSKMSAGLGQTGALSARSARKQLWSRASRRAYATEESDAANASKNGGEKSSTEATPAAPKKATGTSSTLSNLENLYAAFAKQQKEKAKSEDKKAGGVDNKPKRNFQTPVAGARPERAADRAASAEEEEEMEKAVEIPTSFIARRDFYLDAAAKLTMEEDYQTPTIGKYGDEESDMLMGEDAAEKAAQEAREHDYNIIGNMQTKADANDEKWKRTGRKYRPELKVPTDRKSPLAIEKEEEEALQGAVDFKSVEEQEFEERMQRVTSYEEHVALEEEFAIARGELDPTSPQALENKKRNQPIHPRSEAEALVIEQTLISRHRAAVEQVAHVERDLDISSSVPGMAPLTQSQNPYLYNEAYGLGLTPSELDWLSGRDAWRALVNAKITNVALQQRDMKEDRQLVDDLFIKVVNQLTEGPGSAGYIHPEDMKAQQAAFDARKRLQKRLWEIYNNSESQWAALLHKYMPNTTEEGLARNVMDPTFWTPSNPWLLTAFTKQLVEEAEYIEKMTGSDPMEEEIQSLLMEQGHIREDIHTDDVNIGPLGQSSGISAEEEVANRQLEDSKSQHVGCLFCSHHRHRFPLDPMNVPLLARHMTTNGTILPRSATGLCKRHQAKMARTIKQARHLNLFTYKKSLYRINNVFKDISSWTTPDLDNILYKSPSDIIPPTFDVQLQAAELDYTRSMEMTMEQAYEFGAQSVDSAARGDYDHMEKYTAADMEIDDLARDGEEHELLLERLNENILDRTIISSIEAHSARLAADQARIDAEAEEIAKAEADRAAAEAASTQQATIADAGSAFNSRLPRDMQLKLQDRDNQRLNKTKGKSNARQFANPEDEDDELGDELVSRALAKNRRGSKRSDRDSL